MTLLLIEDNVKLSENIRLTLEKENYHVEAALDGEAGYEKASVNHYDLIILDLMLPGMNGFSVLESLRKIGLKTPVLVLSALSEVDDKVKALDLGSDDYLTKPFALSELLARIRSILRRNFGVSDAVIQIDSLVLDTVQKTASRKGKQLKLTAKEFQILEFLVYNRDTVVNRIALEEHVWGENLDPFTASNFLDVHIKNIRKKIDEDFETKLLHTRRGLGYIITNKPIKESES
jgi:DNA-binding response OmpR family regulator